MEVARFEACQSEPTAKAERAGGQTLLGGLAQGRDRVVGHFIWCSGPHIHDGAIREISA